MKEYRIRFVQMSMLLVGTVLIVILTILFSYVRMNAYDNLALTMREMLEPLSRQDPSVLPEDAEKSRFVTVFIGETGTEDLSVFDLSAEYNEDTLYDIVESILIQEESFGELKEQDVIYYRREMTTGYKIAMVDRAYMTTALNQFVFLLAAIWIGAMLLFFGISCFFAQLAVRPLEQARLREKQFVADASHDLKTPLSIIMANNEILLSMEDKPEPDCRKWIWSSQEAALNMQSMIRQMLELYVADATDTSAPPALCSLSEIAGSVALQMEAVAWECGVELCTEIQENLMVMGSREALMRILTILLDNALKYEIKGGKVTVRAYTERRFICVSTHNHAAIAACDLPHVFERYYRADRARSSAGHGLGLSIAQSLANQMHGSLTCKSTASDGTAFILRIKGI